MGWSWFLGMPFACKAVIGFLQQSNRLCCLKLRVPGGKLAVISAYAPHSGYTFNARQQFFEDLGTMYEKTSVNGIKMVFGDLNARVIRRISGEEAFVGEHVFGDPETQLQLGSNRELLLELCASLGLAISNTFFEHVFDNQATFRSIGTPVGTPIDRKRFAQLDLLLVPQGCLHKVLDVRSDWSEPLASHHSLVLAAIAQNFELPLVTPPISSKIDRVALTDLHIFQSFQVLFKESLQPRSLEKQSGNLDIVSECITNAFEAAEHSLPRVRPARRKPWISQTTLDLVEQRRLAHIANRFDEELHLHTEVKKSSKHDKKNGWRIWQGTTPGDHSDK